MDNIFTRVSLPGTQTGERRMTFVASDATRDTYGTVLMPDGWDLERFNKNPVIFYQHDQFSYDPDAIIGKGRAYVEDGKLMVDIEFEPEGQNKKADKVWKKLQFGTLNAVSVGFLALAGEWGKGDEGPGQRNETYYYTSMELLEVSVVAIPANPNALKNAAEEQDRLAELREEAMAEVQEEPQAEPAPAPAEPEEVKIILADPEYVKAKNIAMAEAELLLQTAKQSN